MQKRKVDRVIGFPGLQRAKISRRITAEFVVLTSCFVLISNCRIPPLCPGARAGITGVSNKKTRQDCSRRVPTFVLAGPGAESALPSQKSLAGDPSEVTALGVRHWITSFRC